MFLGNMGVEIDNRWHKIGRLWYAEHIIEGETVPKATLNIFGWVFGRFVIKPHDDIGNYDLPRIDGNILSPSRGGGWLWCGRILTQDDETGRTIYYGTLSVNPYPSYKPDGRGNLSLSIGMD